ncbi:phosphatidate cytidylyltransferase [Nocardioides sp. Y6]|uniref:Phosphatidate cytidylyltransferase n=1 Tax=Nocardioides malaquae TaxID=2773426 RepID=A0ABR9RP51_9ACTN|nr:phosphatidate cytidylyltransferase [Nocardioides malaquae]MBE7323349.1 phosphatidate cytidylyltransferase [Nocardioides malaquae]
MTNPPPKAAAPTKDHGRAGRDLPAAITSGVVLLSLIAGTLYFWKTAFIGVVAVAIVIGIWEIGRALRAKEIDVPEQPLMIGAVVMILVAYFSGPAALVTATAVTALVTMLWLLRRGVEGFVQNATASVFVLVYLPFLASFVGLMLSEGGAVDFERWDDGVKGIVVFVLVTVASDTGGYIAGVLFGKHPMAPVISPKKSWEGFAGSALACVAAGWFLVTTLLDAEAWVGVLVGLIVVVMATLGDLVESVIKRDLGVKDMSQVIPGHGGIMDRLDSLLATIAPVWLLLHYLAF